MSVLIYSPHINPRLEYILEFLFETVLGCPSQLTQSFDELLHFKGVRINYSNKPSDQNILHVIPHELLAREDIKNYDLNVFEWEGTPAFFETSSEKIPFDIFSASFFLITRYEEYLNTTLDEFQRFPHTESIAHKAGFLQRPVIDEWAYYLKQVLLSYDPNLSFQLRQFKFVPTYDIDIAYSYKHKGLLRNVGGALRDLANGNIKALKHRVQVLTNSKQDPFDSFGFLETLHKFYNLSPIYFFLLGSGGKLDKNLPVEQTNFRALIKQISSKNETGIHPSYRSNDEPKELDLELKRLSNITERRIEKSRQHYIRFDLPNTYRTLIKKDITEDYSMGYGSINGFRASTTTPFQWFDLERNEVTKLRVFPFCFMECNAFFEQKQNIEETQKELEHYIAEVKKVNGTFISIWHNFSLGSDPLWKGWREVYEHQIKLLADAQASRPS